MFQINTNIGFMLLHAAGELIKKIQYIMPLRIIPGQALPDE